MREKLKVHDGDTPGKVIEVKLVYLKPKVATMSKIWHKPGPHEAIDDKTKVSKDGKWVRWTMYGWNIPGKDAHDIGCEWAYLDDLLTLETELECTRKALKIASDYMKIMYDNFPDGNRWKWEIEKTLEQIKITMQEQPNDN